MKRLLLAIIALPLALSAAAGAQTAEYQVKARDIYARIVGFRTAAGQNKTAAMAAYLVDELQTGGVPAADITTLEEAGASLLIVRIPGKKPGRPILFSAHMDVVDARPEEWQRDRTRRA